MRNYEYISKLKLDIYYPQAQSKRVVKGSKKVTFSATLVKAELSEEETKVESDHDKIDAVMANLRSTELVGDLTSGKPWLTGSVRAKAITTGRALLFVSSIEGNDGPTYLLLLASMEHLIGADYERFREREVSFDQRRQPIGHLGIEYFEQNSNTLSYAWALRDAYEAEDLANRIDFNFASNIELLRAKHQLYDFELEWLNTRPEFNETMIKIWSGEFRLWPIPPEPKSSFWQWLANLFRVPIVRWKLGDELYRSKMDAVRKNYRLERLKDEELGRDEKTLLKRSDYCGAIETRRPRATVRYRKGSVERRYGSQITGQGAHCDCDHCESPVPGLNMTNQGPLVVERDSALKGAVQQIHGADA